MSKVQIRLVTIHNGKVLSTHETEPLDVDFLETLSHHRYAARQSYGDVLDTPNGVVSVDGNGNMRVIEIVAVP